MCGTCWTYIVFLAKIEWHEWKEKERYLAILFFLFWPLEKKRFLKPPPPSFIQNDDNNGLAPNCIKKTEEEMITKNRRKRINKTVFPLSHFIFLSLSKNIRREPSTFFVLQANGKKQFFEMNPCEWKRERKIKWNEMKCDYHHTKQNKTTFHHRRDLVWKKALFHHIVCIQKSTIHHSPPPPIIGKKKNDFTFGFWLQTWRRAGVCRMYDFFIENFQQKKKSTNIHPLYKYLPTTTPKWIKPEKIRVEFVCQTRGVKRFACLSC